MSGYNWQWVFAQLQEKKATKVAGDATIELLKTWIGMNLTPKQAKETVDMFSKLALGQPLTVSVEKDEQWVEARPGAIKVGDEMMVKQDAYDNGDLAQMHNGRRGRVVRISYGNIILKYTDGREPYLDSAHHSPYKLMKKVS